MKIMRPTRLNARLPVIAAVGAAIAVFALSAGPARAEDGDRPFDEQMIHNVLTSLGLKDPSEAQPSYQERPPLVIPQSDTLPPPQNAGAAIANNPAWPKDPDVTRAKELAKRDKNRDTFTEMLREENPLPPDQLNPKNPGRRQAGRSGGAPSDADYAGRPRMFTPSELGYKGGLFSSIFGSDKDDQQTAQFTGEPARSSLTDPPPGYQTPSPGQPYGLGAASAAPKADNSYISKGEITGE